MQIFPNAAPYAGWSHEYWANPANLDYQNLIVNYVAPKIAAMGFNGFFLDNVELLEHTSSDSGKCDAACKQGGYDMLARLRKKYPNFVIIENNATMLTTMNAQVLQDPDNAQSQRVRFIDLLDGVYAEDIYSDPIPDTASAEVISSHPQPRDPAAPNARLDALKAIKSAFPYIWIGAEDFVEQCTPAYASQSNSYSGYAQRDGLNLYVSTLSQILCFW
jgi:cysteinyl-tRNA synthetase